MKDKITNSIVLHQTAINELQNLKEVIKESTGREVDFIIKTKHFDFISLASYSRKDKLELSNYTINLLIDEAIKKERNRIDKLIDMEVEKKLKK